MDTLLGTNISPLKVAGKFTAGGPTEEENGETCHSGLRRYTTMPPVFWNKKLSVVFRDIGLFFVFWRGMIPTFHSRFEHEDNEH